MIPLGGGELARRRDGNVRPARAAGVPPGVRVIYPDSGSAPSRQPAAEVPRTGWAAPSPDGPGIWSVGASEREPAPERRRSGVLFVVFALVIGAAAILDCWAK